MAHLKIYTSDGKYGLFVFDDGDTDISNWMSRMEDAIDDEFSVTLKAAESNAQALVNGRHVTTVFLVEDEVPWPVKDATYDHTLEAYDVHLYHPTTWACTRCGMQAEFDWDKWDKSQVTGEATLGLCGESVS